MTRARRAVAFGLCASLLAAAGCVRFRYRRVSVMEPIGEAAIQRLAPGETELQACLDALGAPLLVWETPAGMAMAYGWQDRASWNASVSYTWQVVLHARLDYTSISTALEGVVLWFGDDLRLVAIRRGMLRDLLPAAVQRPAAVASDEGGDGGRAIPR